MYVLAKNNLETIWKDYTKLIVADQHLCLQSQNLFERIDNKASAGTDPVGVLPKHLSGSTNDGTAIARWFKEGGSTIIEWDIMYDL